MNKEKVFVSMRGECRGDLFGDDYIFDVQQVEQVTKQYNQMINEDNEDAEFIVESVDIIYYDESGNKIEPFDPFDGELAFGKLIKDDFGEEDVQGKFATRENFYVEDEEYSIGVSFASMDKAKAQLVDCCFKKNR